MKKSRGMKMVGLLLGGATLLQFGGCLNPVFRAAVGGFGFTVGALPAQIVNDVFIAPLIEGLIPSDDSGA